jgi:hypothetical protein
MIGLLTLGCGPGPAMEEETWMLGAFSSGSSPCDYTGQIWQYKIYEDGGVEILLIEPGYTRTWNAYWEQSEPGHIRLMRNESDLGSDIPHPIEPGWEWEITRRAECVLAEQPQGYNLIWHDIDALNLESGQRVNAGRMTPGEMCAEYAPSSCGEWPVVRVTWCDGTEPPPDCAAE